LFSIRTTNQWIVTVVFICCVLNVICYAGSTINAPVSTSTERYPDQLLRNEKKSFKKLNNTYSLYNKLIKVNFITPQSGYLVYKKLLNKPNQPLNKLSVSPTFEPVNNTTLPITQTIVYDYHKPVIVIKVVPRLKMTKAVKVLTLASATASAALPGAFVLGAVPLLAAPHVLNRYEYKQSIKSVKLMSHDGRFTCEPVNGNLSPVDNEHTDFYLRYKPYHLSKKSIKPNLAVYEFDAHCFTQPQQMDLWVTTEQAASPTRLAVPKKLSKQVVKDFTPYWDYVDKTAQPSLTK
jgi:hypothetical protein